MAKKSGQHSFDPEWFAEQCDRAGIKATRQRREIYAALAKTPEHPDAESIHKQVVRRVPSVSLDTVYRNLRLMEEHGIIQRVGAAGYRTRFDANLRPHHHFICTECGMIRDFYDDQLDGYTPPRQVGAIGKTSQLQVELRGICKACQKS